MKIKIGNPSTFHYPLLLYCIINSLSTIAFMTISLPSPSSLLKLPIVSIPLFAYTNSWYTIGHLWQLTTTLSQSFGFARARLTNMSSIWKTPTSHLLSERGRSGRIEVFWKDAYRLCPSLFPPLFAGSVFHRPLTSSLVHADRNLAMVMPESVLSVRNVRMP